MGLRVFPGQLASSVPGFKERRYGYIFLLTFLMIKQLIFILLYVFFSQGMEGPRGPTGTRGSPGEGFPGSKVCIFGLGWYF